MRKIKELEERIDKLERLERCNVEIRTNNDNFLLEKIENIKAKQNEIESKQKEQEEFLKNTVAPFIANAIAKELDKGLTTVVDALADVFAEEPKKKVTQKSKDEKKKVSRPKQKKENK